MAVLKAEPDWVGAANDLVAALAGLPDNERRVQLLERVCADLGDALYPAFVKLLAAVARFGSPAVHALTAEAVAEAIVTARLPSVRLPAWGGGRFPAAPGAFASGFSAFNFNTRTLGPVEFLCVWLQRDVSNEVLDEGAFERVMTLLLTLLDASPKARRLYIDKLRADAEDLTEGLHTRQGRRLLAGLAEGWAAGEAPAAVAARVAAAARAERAADRWSLPPR